MPIQNEIYIISVKKIDIQNIIVGKTNQILSLY